MTDKVFSSKAWRYLTTGCLKSKDNVMVPEMLALALRMDGWYVRSSIIWAKGLSFCPSYSGSVMPESVTDRPTTSHEHVFLLTKAARYYYDAEAVREPASLNSHPRGDGVNPKATAPGQGIKQNTSFSAAVNELVSSRNLRSVWAINPQPFSEAHFATFPTALVEPCVKAGSKTGDLILDPFAGSGTVGCVALKLGRTFVGIELNPDYCTMARESIEGPLFA